jgi:broad specificity phosphatase PhoE
MKLYLVRHGQSYANLKGIHSSPDVELSNEGIEQAYAIANRLKDIHLDFIYSSTIKRAAQTAEIISKAVGMPIEHWDDIREVQTPSVNWGKSINSKKVSEIESLIAKHFAEGDWKHSDEETFNEIHNRSKRVLDHLLSHHRTQHVLCVSHTSFIKMTLLTALLGDDLSPDIYLKFYHHTRINNSGISMLEYSTKKGWVLDSWNDKSHL